MAPVENVYEPAGHEWQLTDEFAAWNFPATHASHEELPVSFVKRPASQLEHADARLAENFPFVHLWQADAWDFEILPAGQSRHEVAPDKSVYVPSTHFKQEVAVVAGLYEPGAHNIHVLEVEFG